MVTVRSLGPTIRLVQWSAKVVVEVFHRVVEVGRRICDKYVYMVNGANGAVL